MDCRFKSKKINEIKGKLEIGEIGKKKKKKNGEKAKKNMRFLLSLSKVRYHWRNFFWSFVF